MGLGELLVEVETEKSVVEIEATVSGRLVEILAGGPGGEVGDQIARLNPISKRTLPIASGVRQSHASLQPIMASISAASRDLARADEFSSRM
jgi:pyruvate/2-oxoglutarate dehydrogenase complex dihydrolipoamide acyltransferase (E2) component